MPIKRDKEYYVEIANRLHNNFYGYEKFEYKNSKTKGIIVCPLHGEFEQSMNDHTCISRPRGCPKCGIKKRTEIKRKTQEQFIEDCIKVHGNKYILDNIVYVNAKSKINPICRIHGGWSVIVNNFIRGQGCPSCNESKGEKLIAKILDENGVIYERQKRYKECRNKRPLPFDFYIPSINTLIEFDGELHFHPRNGVDYETLEQTIYHDTIKTNYCLSRGIPLVRVSYTMSVGEIQNLIDGILSI